MFRKIRGKVAFGVCKTRGLLDLGEYSIMIEVIDWLAYPRQKKKKQ
jgi:hypothetical protein